MARESTRQSTHHITAERQGIGARLSGPFAYRSIPSLPSGDGRIVLTLPSTVRLSRSSSLNYYAAEHASSAQVYTRELASQSHDNV